MANGYVKSLENFKYIPEELYLTIDGDYSKKYTVEQIYNLELKDEEWVSRSVAYSIDCSKSVVESSINLLENKLKNTKVPHKIIAVASDIKHAKQIEKLYNEKNYSTAIVHSELSDDENEKALNDIKNHRVKVVINVSKLGEGYDHPYLSIATIFRAFRNPLPYAQFVGRILRAIPGDEVQKADDNIGQIIAHKHLALDELWKYYKKEIQESEIIQHLKEYDSLDPFEETNGRKKFSNESQSEHLGEVIEIGSGQIIGDAYLTTQLIQKKKEEDKKREQKIIDLQKILNIQREEAERIIDQASVDEARIKRPDLYFASKKKDIDDTIKEKIVPDLLVKFSIDKKGVELKSIGLFRNKYAWIPRRIKDNGGMLAVYFNSYLKYEIGVSKEQWTIDDYDIAYEKLPQIVEYVEKVIEDNLNV
ncbi:DEAD/DEAH box helicase [Bacillus tropicus]|uniref:DEAD/DEAH box helicase n=1 Tax=Bacillus tropicus TaxID=2026188 RepID=UPI0035DCAF7D